jgi:hypothetical protein
MKYESNYIKSILGVNVRARFSNQIEPNIDSFNNPLIHREIKGDKVYVPLDLERLWGR